MNRITRRSALELSAAMAAFSSQALFGQTPSKQTTHHEASAKRVIYIHIHGGLSQVESFDYKPELYKMDGKPFPGLKPEVTFSSGKLGELQAPFVKFKQYGESGAWVSELFPQLSSIVDKLTFIKSMCGSNVAHGGACLKMNTGSSTFIRPSLGAWISYALGTENTNLPAFIPIQPTMGHGGVQNFGSAFLPGVHQGTYIENKIDFIDSTHSISDIEMMNAFSEQLEQVSDSREDTTLTHAANRSLAIRMMKNSPTLFDLTQESNQTKSMYGMDHKETSPFGQKCLLARRLSESGVRFVTLTHGYWDDHGKIIAGHSNKAGQIDQPITALIKDLDQRGLLEETLVVFGTEFGRMPVAQNRNSKDWGRDHNPDGFTYWIAGGGAKAGLSYGATDPWGFYASENKVDFHDFHATILDLLGLNHEKLTFTHMGRAYRLTDVHGHVIRDLMKAPQRSQFV